MDTRLVGSQVIAGSHFGEVLDLDGDTMAIGAPDHYSPPDAAGSVYVFVRTDPDWSEHSLLFASDGHPGDEFGAAVALHGDSLLVGAPSRDGPSGEFEGGAYVFSRGEAGSSCRPASDRPTEDAGAGQFAGAAFITQLSPPGPACPWDLDGDLHVGVVDLLALLSQWAADPGGPPDFDGDGAVAITDLLSLLANWGSCPPSS